MHSKIIAQLRNFDDWAKRVHEASYFFLALPGLPQLSKDSTCSVSAFLSKATMDLNYRDEVAFGDDVLLIAEWLNHIAGTKVESDNSILWTFEENEFVIQLRLWKI
jgi:hypothetical protein